MTDVEANKYIVFRREEFFRQLMRLLNEETFPLEQYEVTDVAVTGGQP